MSWVAVGTTVSTGLNIGSGLIGAFMGRQKAPQFAGTVNVNQALQDYFGSVDKYLPKAQRVASQGNTFNQAEQLRLMETAIPGIGRVRTQLMNQLQEDMTNKGLPTEIEDNLRRKAAEMGVSRGTSGQFEQFNLLRDFGFNMVDWERARRAQALQTMAAVSQISPRVNPMSPHSLLITPNQHLAVQSDNLDRKQAYYNAVAGVQNHNRAQMGAAISGVMQGLGSGLGNMSANMGTTTGFSGHMRNFGQGVTQHYAPKPPVQNFYNSY